MILCFFVSPGLNCLEFRIPFLHVVWRTAVVTRFRGTEEPMEGRKAVDDLKETPRDFLTQPLNVWYV